MIFIKRCLKFKVFPTQNKYFFKLWFFHGFLRKGANVKFQTSYLLAGRSEFGGELFSQLVQLLPEERFLLLQWLALPLKLLLQFLWKPIRNTNLSEQVSNKCQVNQRVSTRNFSDKSLLLSRQSYAHACKTVSRWLCWGNIRLPLWSRSLHGQHHVLRGISGASGPKTPCYLKLGNIKWKECSNKTDKNLGNPANIVFLWLPHVRKNSSL